MAVINRILLVWTAFVCAALLLTFLTEVPPAPHAIQADAAPPIAEAPTTSPQTPAPEAPETKAKPALSRPKPLPPKANPTKPLDIRSQR